MNDPFSGNDVRNKFRLPAGDKGFLIILFFLLLAAYWPIAFGVHAMKWDIMDQALPWRYFIGDALRHGNFPAWNPFLGLGYPAFADPQSGVWYPVSWLLGLLFGYNAYTIELEWFLHILLAAAGMFYFAKRLKLSQTAALLISFGYACSGFMVGNAQHLHWIISAAWIPWLWFFFLKWSSGFETRFAIGAGFSAGFMLTGGYPAFAIVMAYLLLATLLYKMMLHIRKKTFDFRRWLSSSVVLLSCFFIFSAGYLYSFSLALPEITRSGTTLNQALFGSYTSQSFITLFFPMVIGSVDHYFATDISMRNMYAGILMMLLAVGGLVLRPQKRQSWMLIGGGLLALGLSLGNELPLRTWLYQYVPLMDTFRFPALFRLFVFIPMLLLAGRGFDQIRTSEHRNKITWISTSIGLIWLTASLYGAVKERGLIPDPFQRNFLDILAGNFEINIIHWQWMAWLPIGLLLLLSRMQQGRYLMKIIQAAVVMELIIALQFQLPITALSEANTHTVNKMLQEASGKAILAPGLQPVNQFNDAGHFIYPIWYNLGVFYHVPSSQAYNPFLLKGFDSFNESSKKDSLLNQSMANIETADGKVIPAPVIECSVNRISISVEGLAGSNLKLLQNNFPGWTCRVDGKKLEIKDTDFLSVTIPDGAKQVVFIYQTGWLWLLALLQRLGVIAALVFLYKKSR